MRDVWSGNPDTDKFWASEEDTKISRMLAARHAAKERADRAASYFEMADTARHFARVYRKLRLIK